MKIRNLILTAGLTVLAGAQTASAGTYTLNLYQGPNANSNIHYYVNTGQGTITYGMNLGGGGNTGALVLTDGNGSSYGTLSLTGTVTNSNIYIAQSTGVPAHVSGVAAHDGTGDGAQFSWQALVGANDVWHLGQLMNSVQGQQITTALMGHNQGIDADWTAGNLEPDANGRTGGAVLFLGPNGQGDPRFTVGPTCNGAPGCGGDNINNFTTNILGIGNAYTGIVYDRVEAVREGDYMVYHQIFDVYGQGAYTVNGTTISHFSLMPVEVSFVSARINLNPPVSPPTNPPSGGGGGSPAVPEPMTMSLLGSALGIGAVRKRFKKN